jgi:hypothetical protein
MPDALSSFADKQEIGHRRSVRAEAATNFPTTGCDKPRWTISTVIGSNCSSFFIISASTDERRARERPRPGFSDRSFTGLERRIRVGMDCAAIYKLTSGGPRFGRA